METRAEEGVWSRVGFLALNHTPQEICPYFRGCNYVREEKGLTLTEKSNYYQHICAEYSGACEKNLDPRFSKIIELSGEEVHELLK